MEWNLSGMVDLAWLGCMKVNIVYLLLKPSIHTRGCQASTFQPPSLNEENFFSVHLEILDVTFKTDLLDGDGEGLRGEPAFLPFAGAWKSLLDLLEHVDAIHTSASTHTCSSKSVNWKDNRDEG